MINKLEAPPPYIPPQKTISEILAMAGFSEKEYLVVERSHWVYKGWPSGWKDGEWYDGCPPTAFLATKNESGIWQLGQLGLRYLFEGTGVHGGASAKSVLSEMGVSEEKIKEIKKEIKEEADTAEKLYRQNFGKFLEKLLSNPLLIYIPKKKRAEIYSLDSEGLFVPSLDNEWLQEGFRTAEENFRRVKNGEIIYNFSIWHRVGGATRQSNAWVVRPDGSLRDPDEKDVPRHKSDGTYYWEIVGPEELAISWGKGNTAAPHEFKTNKVPTSGCTPEQISTVRRIEQELDEMFRGSTGISGKVSPDIGQGWSLKDSDAPRPRKSW